MIKLLEETLVTTMVIWTLTSHGASLCFKEMTYDAFFKSQSISL